MKKFIFSKFGGLQAYSPQLYYQMNSFTGIFQRVYSTHQNGDTAQKCINTDMIKLLKDEIAFLCGELSRELRSNQKTTEVLLEQYSHDQTH